MVHGRLDQGCGSGSVAWVCIMTLVLGLGWCLTGKGRDCLHAQSWVALTVHCQYRSSLEISRLGDI